MQGLLLVQNLCLLRPAPGAPVCPLHYSMPTHAVPCPPFRAGNVHGASDNDLETLAAARKLMSFLPLNNSERWAAPLPHMQQRTGGKTSCGAQCVVMWLTVPLRE